MTDVQLPYPTQTYTIVEDIRPGDLLRAFPDSHGQGQCQNCRDLSGLTFFWQILPVGGSLMWIRDDQGTLKMFNARLISAPCPVCRGYKKVPTLPEIPDIIDVPPHWTD